MLTWDGVGVAAAVSRVENLEFLTDVVPKTTTYRTFKQKQSNTSGPIEATKNNPPTTNGASSGQGTLDQHMEMQATNGADRRSPKVEIDPGADVGEAMDVDVTEDITEDVPQDVDVDGEDSEIEEEEGVEVLRPPPKHWPHPEQRSGLEESSMQTAAVGEARSARESLEPVERGGGLEEE